MGPILNLLWKFGMFPLQARLTLMGTEFLGVPGGDQQCPSSFSAVISSAWRTGQAFPESINSFVLLEELAVLQRKILIPLSLLL